MPGPKPGYSMYALSQICTNPECSNQTGSDFNGNPKQFCCDKCKHRFYHLKRKGKLVQIIDNFGKLVWKKKEEVQK